MATKSFSRQLDVDPKRIYSIEDQKKLINVSRKLAIQSNSENYRDDIIVRLLFETGRRISELVGQQPSDLKLYKFKTKKDTKKSFSGKFKLPQLVVEGLTPRDLKPETNELIFQFLKKKKVRRILQPISPSLMSDIVQHVKKYRLPPNLTIIRLRRKSVYHIIKRLCLKAGVTFRGVHAIRHRFAINFVLKMDDFTQIYDLQEIMGHADVSITMGYLRYGNRKAKEILSKMQADSAISYLEEPVEVTS